ncbi:ferredoxin [Pilibacter termitis]|uniref:Ferredoxin n=1 Tax=Pilibacter termitis TaxID=263852 RepID=A0A1T4M7D9_9ENTE|nr:ferredoxin [Pilibacter termitis]SJZ62708.1 ferredoxin [Pilibacter termitis]
MEKIQIAIEKDQCIACGLCAVFLPEVLEYDDEGIVLFKHHPDDKNITLEKSENLKKALSKCPTKAIYKIKTS